MRPSHHREELVVDAPQGRRMPASQLSSTNARSQRRRRRARSTRVFRSSVDEDARIEARSAAVTIGGVVRSAAVASTGEARCGEHERQAVGVDDREGAHGVDRAPRLPSPRHARASGRENARAAREAPGGVTMHVGEPPRARSPPCARRCLARLAVLEQVDADVGVDRRRAGRAARPARSRWAQHRRRATSAPAVAAPARAAATSASSESVVPLAGRSSRTCRHERLPQRPRRPGVDRARAAGTSCRASKRRRRSVMTSSSPRRCSATRAPCSSGGLHRREELVVDAPQRGQVGLGAQTLLEGRLAPRVPRAPTAACRRCRGASSESSHAVRSAASCGSSPPPFDDRLATLS